MDVLVSVFLHSKTSSIHVKYFFALLTIKSFSMDFILPFGMFRNNTTGLTLDYSLRCLGMSWNAAKPLYRHPNIIQCLYFTPFLKSPRSPSVNESWLILPSSARRTYAIYNAPVHQETLYIIHLYCVSPFSIIHLQMHTFSNILHSPPHVPSINRVPLILKFLPHHRSISR